MSRTDVGREWNTMTIGLYLLLFYGIIGTRYHGDNLCIKIVTMYAVTPNIGKVHGYEWGAVMQQNTWFNMI